MDDVLRRRDQKILAGVSADEKWCLGDWGLRLLADMASDEAAEAIDPSLGLVPDADQEHAREVLPNMPDDHSACQERKAVPLHQRMASGHHAVPPHAQCQTIRDQTARCRAIADQALEALTRSRALLEAACTLSANTQTRTIGCSNSLLWR